jgi:two-component sensor histidine kinase
MTYSLNNIGVIYQDKGEYDTALEYHKRALKIKTELNDSVGIAYSLNNLSIIYTELKNFDAAFKNLNLSLKILEKLGDKKNISFTLQAIGNTYFSQQNFRRALDYFSEGLLVAEKIGAREEVKNAHRNISNTYSKLNDYKNAYEHFKVFYALNDSLLNLENSSRIAELQAKYETEQKNREIELLANKSQVEELRADRESTYKWIFLGVAAAAILILAGIFSLYLINRKNSKFLAQQKSEIEKKNAFLQQLLNDKEVLFKEIHHRVKNNLQIISSLLNLQSGTVTDKKVLEILRQSQSRVNTMAILHKKLYQAEDLSNIPFLEYASHLTSSISDSMNSNSCPVKLNLKGDSSIRFNVDTAIPLGLILNELVTNSFKHAFKSKDSGVISIELTNRGDNYFVLKVVDDGIGLPEKSTWAKFHSLGLVLVETLVKQLHGRMNTSHENGAQFIIEFPGASDKK